MVRPGLQLQQKEGTERTVELWNALCYLKVQLCVCWGGGYQLRMLPHSQNLVADPAKTLPWPEWGLSPQSCFPTLQGCSWHALLPHHAPSQISRSTRAGRWAELSRLCTGSRSSGWWVRERLQYSPYDPRTLHKARQWQTPLEQFCSLFCRARKVKCINEPLRFM